MTDALKRLNNTMLRPVCIWSLIGRIVGSIVLSAWLFHLIGTAGLPLGLITGWFIGYLISRAIGEITLFGVIFSFVIALIFGLSSINSPIDHMIILFGSGFFLSALLSKSKIGFAVLLLAQIISQVVYNQSSGLISFLIAVVFAFAERLFYILILKTERGE